MEEAKVRIALVGAGRISGKHLTAIKTVPEFELVAVCDIDKEKADKAAKENSCKAYYDYDKMLEKEQLDVVSISTPNGLHPEMTIRAANKKIHVVTEKPMALSLKDARDMIDACKKNKVELFVIKQNRYNPPITKLKEALDNGRFATT